MPQACRKWCPDALRKGRPHVLVRETLVPKYDRAAVRPALVLDRTAVRPRAAVLVLHGGRVADEAPPSRMNLARARMRPFVRSLMRATHGQDVLLGRVRYRCRGWNGSR